MCQLIYCRFHCKNTLSCTITTIGTCSLHICIDNIKSKPVGFCMSVKSDWFMTAESYCCRTVFSVCPSVGQSIKINCLDDTIFICTCAYCDLHLMARWRADHGLISGEDHLGRAACFPGHDRRIDLTDRGLLCTKAATDPWLDHTYFGSRNVQCPSNDPSHMEWDLCWGQNDQSAEMIHIASCAESLHHSLLVCSCMISALYSIFTLCQDFIYISMFFHCGCT